MTMERPLRSTDGDGETRTLLILTLELVKLTVADPPWNLGLKTALNQTTSPEGTDWLLKCVESIRFDRTESDKNCSHR